MAKSLIIIALNRCAMSSKTPRAILLLIVVSQFCGTSSWFAANAVLPAMSEVLQLQADSVFWVTSAVQLGFIVGAFGFALLSIVDRFSPAGVFWVCSVVGASLNLANALWVSEFYELLIVRFMAGLALAGVYPVGMRIAASWYPQGLGMALGFLVGALALGTALPHLFAVWLRDAWQGVLIAVASANLIAGICMRFSLGDGPHKLPPAPLQLKAVIGLLTERRLLASAGGYFGHMWELYSVWALAPLWLLAWVNSVGATTDVSLLSFAVIASGALGCAVGGMLSRLWGSLRVARLALLVSGVCCVLSPWVFDAPAGIVALFWFVWGFSVVADSPQFSSLSARFAPAAAVGTALAMINALGFSLTIVSMSVCSWLLQEYAVQWVMQVLVLGPVFGLLALRGLPRES